MKKSIVLAVTTVMLASGLASSSTYAQEWPQKPIRIIVSFGPGGGADIIGLILADSMQDQLGKPVVVENKPGAGGIIGNEAVANADPDGYTLGIMTAGQIIAAATRKNMRYDTLTAFAPIGQIATASLLIVTRPDFPANNVKELVAAAKADPGKIVFASPGFAATQHFAGEMFKQVAQVNLLHVPFKTSPEAINATLGKHADVLFDTVSALIGHVQSGQLKALAVTGKDRFPAVPDVPAATESGVLPGYDVTTWYGLFAPRGTPAPVIAKLNKTLNDSLADQTVRERLATAGVVVKASTPEAFGDFMAAEFKRWDAVRQAAGIPQQ
ncbi:MAG: tripartite tricarboxylate transporter substrate binding protein [Pseudolabrys sp.]